MRLRGPFIIGVLVTAALVMSAVAATPPASSDGSDLPRLLGKRPDRAAPIPARRGERQRAHARRRYQRHHRRGRGSVFPRPPAVERAWHERIRATSAQFGTTSCLSSPVESLDQQIYQGDSAGWMVVHLSNTVSANPFDVRNDWGDGTVTTHHNVEQFSHVYLKPGRYVVTVETSGVTTAYTGIPHLCADLFSFVVEVKPILVNIADAQVTASLSQSKAITLAVSVTPYSQQPVSVQYATTDGSAVAGEDYVSTSGTLNFAPGDTSKTITISVASNTAQEQDEDFFVDLRAATNATLGRSRARGVIAEPPKPVAAFSITKVTPGGVVELDASASKPATASSSITTYEWVFGDGSTATSSTPHQTHIYASPQNYTVGLRVKDSTGTVSKVEEHKVDVCKPDVPAKTGGQYAWLVRCVEAALPGQPPRQILSTMRQLYYGGNIWSKRVDPRWRNIIPCGLPVPDPTPSLNKALLIALRDAEATVSSTDVGHIWTALEAMECPLDRVTFSLGGVPAPVLMPNYFMASWGGDVGSAAGLKTYSDRGHGTPYSWTDLFGPSGIRAGDQDLSGDVDGLVLHFAVAGDPSCNTAPGSLAWSRPVSEVINEYFTTDPGAFHANRGACLRRMLDLKLKGGVLVMSAKYDVQVFSFAAAYFRAQPGIGNFEALKATLLLRRNARIANEIFARWLQSVP
jgi:PKD repeat protein